VFHFSVCVRTQQFKAHSISMLSFLSGTQCVLCEGLWGKNKPARPEAFRSNSRNIIKQGGQLLKASPSQVSLQLVCYYRTECCLNSGSGQNTWQGLRQHSSLSVLLGLVGVY